MSLVEVVPPPAPLGEVVPLPAPCYDSSMPDCSSEQPPEQASLLAGFYALSLQVFQSKVL